MFGRRLWGVPVAALLLAGCGEDGPVAPRQPAGGADQLLSCQVDVRAGALSCGGQEAGLGGGALGVLLGGQGVYVHLTSNNVGYDEATEVFSAEVAIRNLVNQVIGTTDGSTPAVSGIRIFFVNDPVTTGGTGDVTVRNADGTGDFTATGQPYFEYEQALGPGRTSLSRKWEWNVPSTVTEFSFLVGVSVDVADQAGLQPAGFDFIAQTIDTDSLHTCALDYSGQAWCWGSGGSGRLGNGATTQQSTPVAVQQGSLRFVSIDTGKDHTCALTDTGDMYCWGAGSYGRLGNGDTVAASTPQLVLGGIKFKQLAVSRFGACALAVDGKAYCWGNNARGQLGDGTTEDKNVPTEVIGGHTFKWLAAGGFHTCGVTTDDVAYCWGRGYEGRLGNGSREDVPVPTPTPVLGGHKFSSMYIGQNHTCALTPDGEAWCWGLGGHGRLGIGRIDTISVPEPVATNERFSTLSAGTFHTCGITLEGEGYCWGTNANGKLGVGHTTSGYYTSPEEIVGVDEFASLVAGSDHTCGVTPDGKVYCWGNGANGRLGNGSTTTTGTPTQVSISNAIAFLNGAPESCAAGTETGSCFPRHSLAERIILAARRIGPDNLS